MMWAYLLRRLLWTIPTVLGVVLLTFIMFSLVAKDPARQYAGRFATPDVLESIRAKMGLNKARWVNWEAGRERGVKGFFDSQFFDVLMFRFPPSMRYEESVWELFRRKAPVSLSIQVPAFVIVLGLELLLALLVAQARGTWVDYLVTALAVLGISVPAMSLYLLFQWLLASKLGWFPVAGWGAGFYAAKYAALPILAMVLVRLGHGVRFYRTVVLEEINNDYVRTARSKGLPQREVLLTHVLGNVMIPVVTNTIIALPGLLLGALILEKLFQIPGVGGLIAEAIFDGDRPIVMAMTYLLSIIYCLLLLLTDILYTVVDPRVRLQ